MEWEIQCGVTPESEYLYKDYQCLDGKTRCVCIGYNVSELNNTDYDDLYYTNAQGETKTWNIINTDTQINNKIKKYLTSENIKEILEMHKNLKESIENKVYLKQNK